MRKFVLGLTLFLLSITINAQSDNKSYETDEFVIKYPNSWSLKSNEISQPILTINAPLTSDQDMFSENINIITQDLSTVEVTLQQYFDYNLSQLNQIENGELISKTKYSDDKNEYHKIIFKGTMNNYDLAIIQVYALKNKKAYVVTFTSLTSEFAKLKNLGNKLVTSFKLK